MTAAQIIPELFYTAFLVVYYIFEAVILAVIPNRMKHHKSIQNEIALVTGAGHGIGRSIAIRLARLHCKIILLDINPEWLEETRQMIVEENMASGVYAYVCDVSNRKEVYTCAKNIQNEVGEVGILVNNAGIVSAKYFLDLPDESVTDVFHTNTFAHFWTLKAFLPYMMEQNHGHIVTVASVVGKGAGGQASGYISSKFAAVGLHEAMEMELRALRRTGVQMTLVCPGLVRTGLFEGAEYRYPGLVHVLEPDELAEVVVETMLRNGHDVTVPLIADIGVRLKNLLPRKAFDVLTDFAGAPTMLDNFRGRQPLYH